MLIRSFVRFVTAATLVLALSNPRLSRAQSGNPLVIEPAAERRVQLFWPGTTNFNVLQETLGFDGTNLWQDVPDAPSVIGTRYGLLRDATNDAAFYRLVDRGIAGSSTPPDPTGTATPPTPNVFNDLASLTAFLYSGSNAVQVGVAPGTITRLQAAVIRGTVRRRDNSPLAGVRVAILNHPEFGYTFTRTNGMYDLAVNASAYTVDFQAVGYCPAQRRAQARPQAYQTLPDVILVPVDIVATPVTFGSNAPPQLAYSSSQTDPAGTRSATVFIPGGTTASLVLADGTTQSVSGLTMRVTEFTVGTNGRAAMPADLPPTSEYTYCAEFSADEAINAGAKSIQFNQAVPVYVDNFLNVPVGTLVPVGAYDRDRAVWVPSANGIVMKVLGATNGVAQIDLHGQGMPEPPGVLATNGFTTEELQQLATLYASGKTLWRSPVPHFSIWDFNFGSAPPNPKKPNRPGDRPHGPDRDDSPNDYGTLNFSQQTFTEQIPLVGVPFNLHYSSARLPDYRVDSQLTIPVAWQRPPSPCAPDAPPGSPCVVPPHYYDAPTAIRADVAISGEVLSQTVPGTNQFITIGWDGRDGYGRLIGGTQEASITVAYVYTNWGYSGGCCGPELSQQFPALFGNFGDLTAFEGHDGPTVGVGAIFQQLLTVPDHRVLGLGGWSPTILHRFDPLGGILYYGDGHIRHVPHQSALDDAGLRIFGLENVVAAASDGSLYFFGTVSVPTAQHRLFRRHPDGTYEYLSAPAQDPNAISVTIGTWSKAEGQPATKVSLTQENLSAMAMAPDGSLYVADLHQIARLAPDGIWHVIVGSGAYDPSFRPDGTFATNAWLLNGPRQLAVGPDGSVYFDENRAVGGSAVNGTNYTLVRKIAPDGRLYTVFGGGGTAVGQQSPSWHSLLGSAAAQATWSSGAGINGLAVGQDGSLYIALPNETGIIRITSGGVMVPFLNSAPINRVGYFDVDPADPTNSLAQINGDDGKPADQVISADSPPYYLQVGPDGSVYFTTDWTIWRVNPNGILQRVAGRWNLSTNPPANAPEDFADPLNTVIYPVNAFAVPPDGSLVVVGLTSQQLSFVTFPDRSAQRPLVAAGEVIPAEDGSELYVFDLAGRHLQTLDSLTGIAKWSFSYDPNSLISAITDVAGMTTQIQRNGSGSVTAIIGPYGQKTALGLDANGFLANVTNPANETTTVSNSAGGLLLSITGPRGGTYKVSYDSLGRATQVTDPLGGGWNLAFSDLGVLGDSGYGLEVSCTNSLGDTLSRQMLLQPNGDTAVYYSTGPDAVGWTLSQLSGNQWAFAGDGSILSTSVAADPRFGSAANQIADLTLSLPSGLIYSEKIQRSVGLTNPIDPLSLTGLTNIFTVNGSNSYAQIYNPTNRTLGLISPAGRATSLVGDALGRIIQVAYPGQPLQDIVYDGSGRVAALTDTSSAGIAQTILGYDPLGQLASVTDPMGHTNLFGYDAAGRLNWQLLSDGSAATFTRDSEYNVTSVTPPGRPAHLFGYNLVGLLEKYTPPVVGSDESVTYQYDTERNLKQVNLPDGQTVSFVVGLAGRIEQLTLGAGATWTYQYGTNAGSGFFLPTMVSSTSGDAVRFDYAGSIPTNVSWSGSITGQVSVQFNSDLVANSESVDGSPVAFSYDADRLLTQAGNLTITRDPVTGAISSSTLGGTTDQRQSDDRGLLTNYVARANGVAVWAIALSYDLMGRLTDKVEVLAGVTNTSNYSYDLRGRLAQVSQNGGPTESYTYDATGNRLTHNTDTFLYDAQDRLTSYNAASFSWSPNGDLKTRTVASQTTTYTYDTRGALETVQLPGGQRIDYINDAAGRRIGKKVNGTLQRGWLWNEDRLVAELDANSTVTRRFVYGADDQTPSYFTQGTNTYRIFSDERGSVRLVVNIADGSIAQRLDYDEFGRVLADSNPGFQPFGFAGGLYDPDIGLVRFGARDYYAETGQWTARDPRGFDGGQFSLYAYAGNDPINRIDPVGTGPGGPESGSCDCGCEGDSGGDGGGGDRNLIGTVVQVKGINGNPRGNLLVRRNGATKYSRANLGDPIYLQDVIKTDENTVAAIEYTIGGRVAINRSSQVRVNTERTVMDDCFNLTRIVLRKGGGVAKNREAKGTH